MTDSIDRPIGTSPITDAAAATAPSGPSTDTTYPSDAGSNVSSNADLRVADDSDIDDAAMSPTGLDVANDHADQSPIDRSEESAVGFAENDIEEEDELDEDDDDDDELEEDDELDDDDDEQYTPLE